MDNIKTIIYRDKAVESHSRNAYVFADRYALLEKDPYANAFIYGRKKFFEFLFSRLVKELPPESQILDVGSGTGYLVNELEKKGYQAIGVEPAVGMREQALKKYPLLQIREGTVGELPFPGNSFDAVLAVEVFRYLSHEDIVNGYRECLRVLKPGGFFIATLVNRYALDGFALLYFARLAMEKLTGRQMVNYCDFVSPNEIRKIFKREFGLDAETETVLFSPLRLVYRLNNDWGRSLARKIEKFDENLAKQKWWQPFGGHLIVIVRKK